LDSAERHVEYILVASFDIDRGPIMEHQYPGPISPDESMLAELMLPDQTHVRQQDWTMFFLHKDSALEEKQTATDDEDSAGQNKQSRAKFPNSKSDQEDGSDLGSDDSDEAEVAEADEGPPLMYVLNLVNTKQDDSVKR
jgi:hypothetical protein